jgi:hypothetical protein
MTARRTYQQGNILACSLIRGGYHGSLGKVVVPFWKNIRRVRDLSSRPHSRNGLRRPYLRPDRLLLLLVLTFWRVVGAVIVVVEKLEFKWFDSSKLDSKTDWKPSNVIFMCASGIYFVPDRSSLEIFHKASTFTYGIFHTSHSSCFGWMDFMNRYQGNQSFTSPETPGR